MTLYDRNQLLDLGSHLNLRNPRVVASLVALSPPDERLTLLADMNADLLPGVVQVLVDNGVDVPEEYRCGGGI